MQCQLVTGCIDNSPCSPPHQTLSHFFFSPRSIAQEPGLLGAEVGRRIYPARHTSTGSRRISLERDWPAALSGFWKVNFGVSLYRLIIDTISSSASSCVSPTRCGWCLTERPYTIACLNCSLIDRWMELQKSSTVQALARSTTGAV